MKSYTNIEQSKVLAGILPHESADMRWYYKYNDGDKPQLSICNGSRYYIPCWSLAALIDVLPRDWWGHNEHYFLEISKQGDTSKPNKVCYFRFRKDIDGANYSRITHISHTAENLVDACVNMIITLHEHKLLNK